jgi:hypothetical protein
MSLVFLDHYCVTLSRPLSKTGNILPLISPDKLELLDLLGEDGFSYLTISSITGNTEDVKIFSEDGEIALQRGKNETEPLAFSVGRCACFKITKAVLDEYLTNPPGVCTVTLVSGSEDYLEITPPSLEGSCEWTVGFKQVFIDRLNECCPVDDCSICIVSDGTYENATVTVINGKVCNIEQGKNIVYTGGSSCCGCDNCIEEAP